MTQHSSEKDVPPQGVSTFRMLLRRHAQVLTFVGALVVFATFIVREEVRENLKDLIASIDSAQSVFSTRRDVAVIADELDVLGTITVDISGAAMAGKTQTEKFVAIFLLVRFRLLVVKARFAALAASLDNTSRLLAKLSPDSTQTAKVAELRNRLLEDQKRCKEAINYIDPTRGLAKPAPSDEAIAQIYGDLLTKYAVPLMAENLELFDQIDKLSTDMFRRADLVKEERERLFRLVTWLSIFLFALGWGLGLAAKLAGIDEGTAEE